MSIRSDQPTHGTGSKRSFKFRYGADTVFVYDHPALREFDVLNYRNGVVEPVREQVPEILLVGTAKPDSMSGGEVPVGLPFYSCN